MNLIMMKIVNIKTIIRMKNKKKKPKTKISQINKKPKKKF